MGRRRKKNGIPQTVCATPTVEQTPTPHILAPVPVLDDARRVELRRKLHNKIRNRDQGQHAARQLINDPTLALLQMGVDDPNILRAAPGLVKTIVGRVKAGVAVSGGPDTTTQEVYSAGLGEEVSTTTTHDDSSDEEEAPHAFEND